MAEDQDKILKQVREEVVKRDRELQEENKSDQEFQSTLDALEQITKVPRKEIERIASTIKDSSKTPPVGDGNQDKENTEKKTIQSILTDLPVTVQVDLDKLSSILLEEYMDEYLIHRKSLWISYLLWLVPPPFSAHYLFLGKPFSQIFYSLSCGGLLVWWLADLFRMPGLVAGKNRKLARKLIKTLSKKAKASP